MHRQGQRARLRGQRPPKPRARRARNPRQAEPGPAVADRQTRATQKGRSRADHRPCQVRRPPRTQPSRRPLRRRHQRRPRRAEGSLYACASAAPRRRNRSPNLSAVRSARDRAKSRFRGRAGHGPRSCGAAASSGVSSNSFFRRPFSPSMALSFFASDTYGPPHLTLLAAEGPLAELASRCRSPRPSRGAY